MQERKDALELSRMKLEEERRDKALKLAHKDAEMADMRQKMEDMALEFGAPRALAPPASSVVVFFGMSSAFGPHSVAPAGSWPASQVIC